MKYLFLLCLAIVSHVYGAQQYTEDFKRDQFISADNIISKDKVLGPWKCTHGYTSKLYSGLLNIEQNETLENIGSFPFGEIEEDSLGNIFATQYDGNMNGDTFLNYFRINQKGHLIIEHTRPEESLDLTILRYIAFSSLTPSEVDPNRNVDHYTYCTK